jgi:hypothetical protein
LSDFRIKNPKITINIGCRCPIITALTTGTCDREKTYIKSAKRVATIAIYIIDEKSFFDNFNSLGFLLNKIYKKATSKAKIALIVFVWIKSEFSYDNFTNIGSIAHIILATRIDMTPTVLFFTKWKLKTT